MSTPTSVHKGSDSGLHLTPRPPTDVKGGSRCTHHCAPAPSLPRSHFQGHRAAPLPPSSHSHGLLLVVLRWEKPHRLRSLSPAGGSCQAGHREPSMGALEGRGQRPCQRTEEKLRGGRGAHSISEDTGGEARHHKNAGCPLEGRGEPGSPRFPELTARLGQMTLTHPNYSHKDLVVELWGWQCPTGTTISTHLRLAPIWAWPFPEMTPVFPVCSQCQPLS